MMNLGARLKAAVRSFEDPLFHSRHSAHSEETQPPMVLNNVLLAGKNILVTGAGRNIGRSIVMEMAKQGANVFFTDIEEKRCRNLEEELSSHKISSRWFISDVSKTEDVERLSVEFRREGVAIDVLVNNVGIQFESPGLQNLNLREWDKTFQTNVFGPLYLTKLVSEIMIGRKIQGSILFITSVHQSVLFGYASYSCSKAALGMLIRELALELAPHKIRVNGIAPGWVAEDEKGNPRPFGHHPLTNTSITPAYIGRTAVYLASDYFSKFTTGTIIQIDAGLTLINPYSR
jgi:NAD(P)-dependent dehydrogenase (short-subunit alcohol dehydrogenase family)